MTRKRCSVVTCLDMLSLSRMLPGRLKSARCCPATVPALFAGVDCRAATVPCARYGDGSQSASGEELSPVLPAGILYNPRSRIAHLEVFSYFE
jgi:hypothetical protein